MHVSPHHKKPGWQRFFAGAFFGGLIAYAILLFMHGTMQEKMLEENLTLRAESSELKTQNEALLKDNKNLDEKTKEEIKIDSIDIEILNAEDMKFDRLLGHQLTELIKKEIDQVIGSSVSAVSENAELLISTVENETFRVDEFSYKLQVRQLTIYKTIHIAVKVEFAK